MLKLAYSFIFITLFLGCKSGVTDKTDKVSSNIDEWLAKDANNREPLESLEFATKSLTKDQAETIKALLYEDKRERMIRNYEVQWDNRLLSYLSYSMPFYYQIFGDEPSDGRSLFISLHGGGGAAAEVNDQQYNNQKHLYDATMNNLEGVYLAPRAPGNTWDLWHQHHIDEFLNIIIQMAVVKENVNPNKVYILGYSAGGDGVYQLAPRMADRWAAASMMAGHPNDASPLSLRNTPFTIHMGALDDAYDRNLVAQQWDNMLNELQQNDPQAYIHDVQIHEGFGHWMNLQDAVALGWMKNYVRNPVPQKVVWKQDNRHHKTFYWLGMPGNTVKDGDEIIAEYDKDLNEINIIENTADTIQLMLNDEMLDLNSPITVKYQGNIIGQETFSRTVQNIYESMDYKGDSLLSFPCIITLVNNETVLK